MRTGIPRAKEAPMSHRTRGPLRLLALLSVLVLVFAACGDDDDESTTGDTSSGQGKKTIAIAFVGPLTGPNANLGINIRDGMRVAIEEANEASDDYRYQL